MSAIDFSDSCRTHRASVDLARGRRLSTKGRALKVTLDRGLQLRIAPDGRLDHDDLLAGDHGFHSECMGSSSRSYK